MIHHRASPLAGSEKNSVNRQIYRVITETIFTRHRMWKIKQHLKKKNSVKRQGAGNVQSLRSTVLRGNGNGSGNDATVQQKKTNNNKTLGQLSSPLQFPLETRHQNLPFRKEPLHGLDYYVVVFGFTLNEIDDRNSAKKLVEHQVKQL